MVHITPTQLLTDSAVPPAGFLPQLRPWQKPAPPALYKYYPPKRLHVLTDCKVRFSQRQVFDDQFDLRPKVANFGTADEIRQFMEFDPVLSKYPQGLKNAVVKYVLSSPDQERKLILGAQKALTAPEEFGVFCLCENIQSRRMWRDYGLKGTGFAVEFNTQHSSFSLLTSPGLMGRVEYGDQPISSFLSTYGASAFFRKRLQYSFEAEWRSVRALKRFTDISNPATGPAVFLASFDPKSIGRIVVLPTCAVEWELRTLLALDVRYRHVPILVMPSDSLKKP